MPVPESNPAPNVALCGAPEDLSIIEAPLVDIVSESDWIAFRDYPYVRDFNSFDPLVRQWPPKSGSVSKPLVLPKSEPPKPRDLGYELASALRAKADVEQEKAEANIEFKARLERLQTQINMLQHDILTGQTQLPLELPEEPSDRKSAGAN